VSVQDVKKLIELKSVCVCVCVCVYVCVCVCACHQLPNEVE
jgi:hypothetical protein